MVQKKQEGFWWANCAGVIAVALVLGILIFGGYGAPSASAAPGKDKSATRVYQHTYDEVFQASLEAIERMGLFVENKDKDKGIISGSGKYKPSGWQYLMTFSFDIQVESLNTKPEARLTINFKKHGGAGMGREEDQFGDEFVGEVQKVLATYH
jgi:hypothetical protein